MIKNKSICLAYLIFLSGCSAIVTEEISLSESKSVPKERLFNQIPSSTTDTISFVVKRDAGYAGSACQIGIQVDDDFRALFQPNEATTIKLQKKTEYKLAVVPNPYSDATLCGKWSPNFQLISAKDLDKASFRIKVILGEVSLEKSLF